MSETTATSTMSGDGTDAPRAEGSGGLVLIHATPVDSAPRALVLEGRSAVIGREPPAGGFTIAQQAVSRIHAALETVGGTTTQIRDLSSRNGTFVNGERITAATLRPGDVVRIGDAAFAFVEDDARAHLAYPIEGAAFAGLVGGHSMAKVVAAVDVVARTEAAVLVSGETGVGKELVARAIHAASGRRGRLAAINSAALPAALFESELFGVERGAFTGADRAREGLVRSAEGGTLFLDEIGDMPLEVQAKLLRLLQNREVLPLGATHAIRVDVRVVCATHRDLPALVREGRFRGDLYARIAQRIVSIPPLRDRREDLYALVRHALAGRPSATPTFPFMLKLALHDWPFNVREPIAAVEHAADLAGGGELRPNHLASTMGTRSLAAPPPSQSAVIPSSSGVVRERRKGPTIEELSAMLTTAKGNVAAVARTLERDPAQVYRWLRQFKLDPDDFR